jgi:HprK-related kinase A
MLHSAVLEYGGKALIMPAMPGSGKSTLCSALMLRGWRLLSDEFGLVDPQTRQLIPIPRAIPLKNESISVIRAFDKQAFMGPVFPGTRKGDIAHLAPNPSSFNEQDKKVNAALLVFPQYTSEFSCNLQPISKSLAFTRLSSNSFNYKLTQEKGFRTITGIIQKCDCYALQYHDMDAAIKMLTELMEEKAAT